MKADFKGKIIEGKVAELFVKLGLATEIIEEMSAKECVDLIKSASSIEDIIQFENDSRKTVKTAFDKRLKELG